MAAPSILAKALRPGDTIAFVSLSARLNEIFPNPIARASSLFESYGYKVRVFFTPNENAPIQTGIADRLSELRAALVDPTISAVVCTIGGETFTELLPALIADSELHEKIRANPKIVVGYSDNTGLHWFLHALTGLRTFYGPTAIPELGTSDSRDDQATPLAFCVSSLFNAITKTEPLGKVPRSLTYAPEHPTFFQDPQSLEVQKVVPSPAWSWLRPGKAQGRLFGGLLGAVVRLNGVRAVAPDWRDRIIFLETAVSEADDIGAVRTAFADLIAQGVFDSVAGLVVGRPFGYDSDEAREEYAGVITGLLCNAHHGPLAKKKFPILFNVDFGHTTPMVTLPFDTLAVLDSDNDQFEMLEAGVEESPDSSPRLASSRDDIIYISDDATSDINDVSHEPFDESLPSIQAIVQSLEDAERLGNTEDGFKQPSQREDADEASGQSADSTPHEQELLDESQRPTVDVAAQCPVGVSASTSRMYSRGCSVLADHEGTKKLSLSEIPQRVDSQLYPPSSASPPQRPPADVDCDRVGMTPRGSPGPSQTASTKYDSFDVFDTPSGIFLPALHLDVTWRSHNGERIRKHYVAIWGLSEDDYDLDEETDD
ncbi:peptidase u61 ld-carboxypeptidase a [Akanthomyces lecanii RCEF 1005]|uniref:Peptidase u61 ld-carboxypeptidase a n=1 Tax=Akanthomyces lecanii RCEF 1005 TaxID=1081108 RepID=A0A168BJN4_CORDF|nr:peptidase u61 ld-carboxypeptidase a [Akanthomyces lecanii RCEF 1005]